VDRITFTHGEPFIRNLNLKAFDVLRWLGSGATEEEIAKDHPGLERQDFMAVYKYAALVGTSAIATERFKEIGQDIKRTLHPGETDSN
jgi:uncharacterized protein (DUF433 family)